MSSPSAPVAYFDADPDPSGPRRGGGQVPISRLQIETSFSSTDDGHWPAAEERLRQLADHSFVRGIAALPDVHWKDDMELPSSVSVDSGDYVVPNVTSVAMNDCMTVIITDWRREQVDRGFLAAFFENVNRRASARRAALTAYSPNRSELLEMIREGAAAAVRKYRLPPETLDAMERRGQLPVDDVDTAELQRLVPQLLLKHPSFRAEFGLNFGGNHFLEVQTVGDVIDPALAREWNLSPGQVTLMTHLGPGPFTGNLLHLYSSRTKVRRARKVAYTAMKVPLHFVGRHRSSLAERYRAYFKQAPFAGFALDSEIGQDLDRVIRLGCNFGFAYQVGCYKAVIDALAETARESGRPDPNSRMLWSVSHNHIFRERIGQRDAFVGRHNSVRSYADRPALLSGNYDVDTCLGVGLSGGQEYLHSYDHGIGALLARAKQADALPEIGGHSTGFKFHRGQRDGLDQVVEHPLRSRQLIEQVAGVLEHHEIIRPVCYLRPLGTMRN